MHHSPQCQCLPPAGHRRVSRTHTHPPCPGRESRRHAHPRGLPTHRELTGMEPVWTLPLKRWRGRRSKPQVGKMLPPLIFTHVDMSNRPCSQSNHPCGHVHPLCTPKLIDVRERHRRAVECGPGRQKHRCPASRFRARIPVPARPRQLADGP